MDDPIHELLLRLAGRVDDDLLADARELVAVGEDGHALELVTAALAADAAPLPPAVRAELVNAAEAARIDLDADAALAAAAPDTTAHRFSATADADVPVVAAARELPNRLREGVRLRLTWRQTPAGPAPTPLPQPVLLVETAADGRPGEVLAYQVGAAMARAGVHVAVEVLTSGRPLTSYHAAALRDSTPVSGDAPPQAASPPEKVESVVAEVVEQVTASHRGTSAEARGQDRPVDLFAVEDEPAPRPVPMRAWQSGRRRRGFGEQVAEVDVDDDLPDADDHERLPSPVPLARRSRPRPVGDVVEQADPLLDPIPDEGSWSDEWASGDWTVAETDADDAPGRSLAEGAQDADNAAGSAGAGGLTSAGGSTADPRNATADPRTADPRSATADPRSVTPDPRGAAAVPHNSTADPRSATAEPRSSAAVSHHHPTADPRSATADPGSAEAVSRNPTPDPRGAVASPNPIAGPPGTTPDLRKATSGPRGTDAGPAGPFAGPHDASQATPPTGLPSPTADPHPFGGPGADGGPATPHSVTAGPPTDVAGDARPSYPGAAPTDPADDTPVGSHALFTDQTPRLAAAPAGALPPGPPPTPDTTPERATGNGPAHALAEPPTGPLPVVSGPMADALLKPEALARLSDADRELLTRLQAELAGGTGSPGPNGAAPA